jgi:hypothetical protein
MSPTIIHQSMNIPPPSSYLLLKHESLQACAPHEAQA